MKPFEIAIKMDLALTTVTTIIKDKNRLLSEIKTAASLSNTIIRKRHGVIAKMESWLKMWCDNQVEVKQCPVTQNRICNEAQIIFKRLKSETGENANHETFVASNGSFTRFEQRCNWHRIGKSAVASKKVADSSPSQLEGCNDAPLTEVSCSFSCRFPSKLSLNEDKRLVFPDIKLQL